MVFPFSLEHNASILAQLVEPHRFPVLSRLRSAAVGLALLSSSALGRRGAGAVGRASVCAPPCSPATWARSARPRSRTIYDIGDGARLDGHIERAFPGVARRDQSTTGARSSRSRCACPACIAPLDAASSRDGTLALSVPGCGAVLAAAGAAFRCSTSRRRACIPICSRRSASSSSTRPRVRSSSSPRTPSRWSARLGKARDVRLVELRREAAETMIV